MEKMTKKALSATGCALVLGVAGVAHADVAILIYGAPVSGSISTSPNNSQGTYYDAATGTSCSGLVSGNHFVINLVGQYGACSSSSYLYYLQACEAWVVWTDGSTDVCGSGGGDPGGGGGC